MIPVTRRPIRAELIHPSPVSSDKGQPADASYGLLKAVVRACTALCGQTPDVAGVPGTAFGPKIIAANHPNVSDAFLFPQVFAEPLSCLVQADVFQTPLFGPLMASAGQIPVERGRGIEAIQAACHHLAQGRSIVIFPEGRLNPNGDLFKAATGAVRIALQSGVPILPVGLFVPAQFTLTFLLPRRGRIARGRWQFGGRCFIQLGEPWPVAAQSHRPATYKVLRSLSDELMARIHQLTGQAMRRAAESGECRPG